MGSGKLVNRAIKKHGLENFSKEILHILSSKEEMDAKEKELVVVSEETYNLCEGGQGGFWHINSKGLNSFGTSLGGKIAMTIINANRSYESRKKSASKALKTKLIKYNKNPYNFCGKNHTNETKLHLSNKAKERLKDPTKNSQYGTCWITNGQENKKIKKEDVDLWVELGYTKGRNIMSEKELCRFCKGTKQYLMNGDAHRSSGIVPCRHCDADGYYNKPEESFIAQVKVKKTPQEIYEEEYLKWLLTP